MSELLPLLRAALAGGAPAVLVTVAEARGSTPREAGARMLVTGEGEAGTIGGGRLELEAILKARAMIREGSAEAWMDVPLGPRIGQCCGGHVGLSLERADAALLARVEAEASAALAARPHAYVFGAGHTGLALARALAPLPLRPLLVDGRANLLAEAPPGVETVLSALPEAVVADAPRGAAFLVMTHDHGLDFLLASAALARQDAAYVGMIGSATKRARLAGHLAAEGRGGDVARLTCPLGGGAVRDKRPEVIAALTAAEVVACLFSRHSEALDGRLAEAADGCHSADHESGKAPRRHAATP